jgi:type IV pilus assembly protein PilE
LILVGKITVNHYANIEKIHHAFGVTLIELMIVLTIAAIIAAIALPSYFKEMTETRRSDAKAKLMEIMNAEERYYTVNNTYTTDLENDLNYPVDGASKVDTDEGYYKVSAAACGSGITNCIELSAEPGQAQSDDGSLTLDSLGVKTPGDKW